MFLIIKLPRSGSTWLGRVLNSHSEIECKNEILNPIKSEPLSNKQDYLKSYFSHSTQKSHKTLGGSINPFKYDLQSRDLRFLTYPQSHSDLDLFIKKNLLRRDPEIKLILLLRRNKLRQAISSYQTYERGCWESSSHLLEGEDTAATKKDFDLNKLQKITVRYWTKSMRLRRFAQSLSNNFMTVFYEDMYSNPKEEFERLFDYIGVSRAEEDFDYSGGFSKINSEDIKDIVGNYNSMSQVPVLECIYINLSADGCKCLSWVDLRSFCMGCSSFGLISALRLTI